MHFHRFLPPLLRDAQALRSLGTWRLLAQALTTGAVAGGVIGAFRLIYDVLLECSASLLRSAAMTGIGAACLAGGLLGLGLLAHVLVRHEPLISGSGIPQVELMVMGRLPPMRWTRVLWCKFVGTLAALWAGLSVGREGPSIQMGAAVGMGVGRLFHDGGGERLPRHLIGGAVAGLTAAFGAPLAGLCFAFEEMRAPLTPPLVIFVAVAAATAWLVVSLCFGFGLVFPFAAIPWLEGARIGLVVPVGLFTALLGAAYNRSLLGLTAWEDSLRGLPAVVRSLFPFALSGVLLCVFPAIVGGDRARRHGFSGCPAAVVAASVPAAGKDRLFLHQFRIGRFRGPAYAHAGGGRHGRSLLRGPPACLRPAGSRPDVHAAGVGNGGTVCGDGARTVDRIGAGGGNGGMPCRCAAGRADGVHRGLYGVASGRCAGV